MTTERVQSFRWFFFSTSIWIKVSLEQHGIYSLPKMTPELYLSPKLFICWKELTKFLWDTGFLQLLRLNCRHKTLCDTVGFSGKKSIYILCFSVFLPSWTSAKTETAMCCCCPSKSLLLSITHPSSQPSGTWLDWQKRNQVVLFPFGSSFYMETTVGLSCQSLANFRWGIKQKFEKPTGLFASQKVSVWWMDGIIL